MKYYAAVWLPGEIKAATLFPPYNILCSYHAFKTKPELIKECIAKGYDVFIDSGAFSAENSGKPVDIDEYSKWLLDVGASTYAGLDVIGDAKATRENIAYMEGEYGLLPIPAFHMGSDIKDLEKVAGGQYSYIALGGLVFARNIQNHCDAVWRWIMKENPKLRVHGFGVTNLDYMKRWPWYSVDSSSFKGCKRYGRQNILYNGMEWEMFEEDKYLELLASMGYVLPEVRKKPKVKKKELTEAELAEWETLSEEITEENRHRWFIYDLHGVQSFKTYAAHLAELNKYRKFEFLTSQSSLF